MNWRPRLAITPSDILPACRYQAIFGFLTGPFVCFYLHWLFSRPMEEVTRAPLIWCLRASITGSLSAVAFYLLTGMPWVFLREPVRRLPRTARVVIGIVVSGTTGVLFALVSIALARAIWGVQVVPDAWVSRLLVADAITIVCIGFAMGAYHEARLRVKLREQALSEAAARAQVYALQAQIAPHFFFNCLNSVSALIDSDPAAARQMLGGLAGVFRYTFTAGRTPLVTLAEELAFVREYLALEQHRYRDRLRLQWAEPGACASQPIPALSLQPLFENAIRHGISKRMDGGEIRLEFQASDETLRIDISNQFDPTDGPPDLRPERLFRDEHALANVRERLRLAFREDASFEVVQAAPEWVRASVTVPLKPTLELPHARTGC